MKKYIFFGLALLIIFLIPVTFGNAYAYANNSYTSARAMVVIETTGNSVLYSKNKDQKLAMASTTKIATAITVIDNVKSLDEIVEVKKASTLIEGTSIYLREGEKLSVRQLLYGLMLQSGNDAAHALATYVSPNVADFSELMNQTAKKVGALNSNFVNPHGLDATDHYTTAHDLALITSYALKNKDFKEIVSCKNFKIEAGENNTARSLVNKNRLLNSLQGCVGVKTGYTSKAGRCLVTAAERDGMEVVCVVLNCGPMFEESSDLILQAFKEYSLINVITPYNFVSEILVEDGNKEKVRIYNKEGFSIVLKEEDIKNINVSYDFPDKLKAPLKKDQEVGSFEVFLNNHLQFSSKLYIIEEVESISMLDKLKDIIDNWN